MTHVCSEKCFTAFNLTIRKHIATKIKYHIASDSLEKYRGCAPTMTKKEGFLLLLSSRGKCSLCQKQLRLHTWNQNDPNQFSFDRLDDFDTHHSGNLQITCLGCNLLKADNVYKPLKSPQFAEYNSLVSHFRQQKSLRRDPEMKKYLSELTSYLAYLHDIIYEDRKENGWKKYSVPSSRCPPLPTPTRHVGTATSEPPRRNPLKIPSHSEFLDPPLW